jgi:phenylacetic acid degradation operon negative regulatory protein
MTAEERAAGDHARALLLTILGEYVAPRGGSVWTGTLVAALAEVGVREKAARQALARSASDGWLTSERVGRRARWRLTPATGELLAEGARRIYSFGAGRPDWDGRWLVLVVSIPEAQRHLRHRLRTRLAWAGFGSLGQGVWVSPEAARAPEAAGVVEALGPAVSATSFIGRHGDLGDESSLVERAWDLPELRSRYEAFMAEFCAARPTGDAETFSIQTRLVHQWRRFPFLDPGLPDSLLPPTWPGRPARELFQRRHGEWGPPARSWFEVAAAIE